VDAQSNGWISLRGGTMITVINDIEPAITVNWGHKIEVQLMGWVLTRLADPLIVPWVCWGSPQNPNGYSGMPIPYQVGWGFNTGLVRAGNTMVFLDREAVLLAGNTGGGNYTAPSVQDFSPNGCNNPLSASDFIRPNLEYYAQVDGGLFDGTSGCGQGLRAARPASTSGGATGGVCYWATDQGGDWNKLNTTTNDGCLDRVFNGAWVDCWYIPFVFPHPLANPNEVTPPTPPPTEVFVSGGTHQFPSPIN
jgi:hypothetical protein